MRASHNRPVIPPKVHKLEFPLEEIEPEFEDCEILQFEPPSFGSNAPEIPPTNANPTTVPVNETLVAVGRELVHDVFWFPRLPAIPPT